MRVDIDEEFEAMTEKDLGKVGEDDDEEMKEKQLTASLGRY